MTRRFEPTAAEREQVRRMCGHGLPAEMIARLVRSGISPVTLRRAFADDLAQGRAVAAATIVQTLFDKAAAGDTACLLFWCKTRLQWREVVRAEVTGADGVPLAAPPAGVMLVPSLIDPEAWEKAVSEQQQRLTMDEHARSEQRDAARRTEH
jgi:hypothetical protein